MPSGTQRSDAVDSKQHEGGPDGLGNSRSPSRLPADFGEPDHRHAWLQGRAFAKAFRLAPVPTTIRTAEDHRFIEVNNAFTRVLGYQVQDVVGYPADDTGLWVDDEERRRFEAELARTGSVRD